MQYSGHATGQDAVTIIRNNCKATSNTLPIAELTSNVNAAIDWYLDLAAKAGKRMPWDDPNQPSAPRVTQTLTSGTNSYKFSAFSGSLLYTHKLQVLDSQGNPQTVEFEEFAEADFDNEYKTSNTGVPTKFTVLGDFIYFDKTPNYTAASGVIAFVTRQSAYMTTTDTVKQLPCVPVHDHLLCRKASLPYIRKYLPEEYPNLKMEVAEDEKAILNYFGYSKAVGNNRLSGLKENNR